MVTLLLASLPLLWADDPTSRFVSLSAIPTSLPASTSGNAVQFEIWNQATGGIQISTEAHTVDTDGSSNITNDTGFADLLLGRPGGLIPANYTPGESRYLDVTQSGMSKLAARIPLYASPFTISPGPQGPPGPAGAQGPHRCQQARHLNNVILTKELPVNANYPGDHVLWRDVANRALRCVWPKRSCERDTLAAPHDIVSPCAGAVACHGEPLPLDHEAAAASTGKRHGSC